MLPEVWQCATCLPVVRVVQSARSCAQEVLASLQELVCGILAMSAADAGPLTTASLGSLGALKLHDAVAMRFGVTLPAPTADDHTNLRVAWLGYPLHAHACIPLHFHCLTNAQTQDLAAEVVARLQAGTLLSRTAVPSAHEHPARSAAIGSSAASGVDALLHKCILGVLGVMPAPHQPLMEVRKHAHAATACLRN